MERIAISARFEGEAAEPSGQPPQTNPRASSVYIEAMTAGTLEPSAEPDLLHGAVMWRISEGRGRFANASGLITSNFVLQPTTGAVEDRQVALVFLP